MKCEDGQFRFPQKPPSIVYWLGNNLYLNITNQCSNSCYYCFRKYKNGIDWFNLKLHIEPSQKRLSNGYKEFSTEKTGTNLSSADSENLWKG